MVTAALKQKCSHILMMDTDQVFYNPTMILKMQTEIIDKKVMATVVYRAYRPFDPLVFRFGKQGLVKVPDEEIFSGEVIDADAVGCGCVMYDMKVFKKIDSPWFEDVARVSPDGENPPGEDINFCYKLKAAGFKIHVDTSIKIDHIFLGVANRAWYLLYKKITEAHNKEK
jgi:GT2 family glycosyltransferase